MADKSVPHAANPPLYSEVQLLPSNQQRLQHRSIAGETLYGTTFVSPSVGPRPTQLQCPSCHQHIVTRMNYEMTTRTHICAALLCLICFCCAWVPYVLDSCKNANHYCPHCEVFLGTYKS